MKKLRLDVESLKVESFETVPTAEGKGTVLGQETLDIYYTCGDTCNNCPGTDHTQGPHTCWCF